MPEPLESIDVVAERMVAGGSCIAHLDDGRVALVEGALPGERVEARVTEERPKMVTAIVEVVLEPSSDRIAAPCVEVERGCGGCDLQYAEPSAQPNLKIEVVRDALRRLARLTDVPIDPGVPLPADGYRTTVRAAVRGGRAGFRSRRSNDVVTVDSCMVAHPLVEEVLIDGRFDGATEVVVRVGARTGERMVVVSPNAESVSVPADVRVVGTDELERGRRAWIHEELAGHTFRVSAQSFFQARPDGAEALVEAVRRALGDPGSDAALVDLYGGVGLFSVALGSHAPVLVERSASAVADARVNLAERDAMILKMGVRRWRPVPADVVVADPARSGLGVEGVAAVVGSGAPRVALVSCDPASLARDVGQLVSVGYRPLGVELVDLFPRTHHLEAVTALELTEDAADVVEFHA